MAGIVQLNKIFMNKKFLILLEELKKLNFPKDKYAVFGGNQIRRQWDENKELWYFSIVDIIQVLTESSIPKRYWSDLKIKLQQEGSQLYEKIVQLKLIANDGKYYNTDVADTETMFRIIQSIPSPKAEPFKLWLAKVGYERLEENEDLDTNDF